MLDAFLALWKGEQPEEIVWTADISYWLEGRRARDTRDPAWEAEEGLLALHRELGILPYYFYGGDFSVCRVEYDDAIAVTREPRGSGVMTRIRTPLGELVEETAYLTESSCQAISKHFVETPRDLDALRCLLEHRRLAPHLAGYPRLAARLAEHDGYAIVGLPRSPAPSLFVEWAGVLNGVYLLFDCEETVREALGMMEAQEEPLIDALCELAPPLVHFCDNLTSEHYTGLFDELIAPSYRRWLGRLHGAGVKCAAHLDGTVRGLLPKLAAVGFDSVESLTPKPVGDITAAEMRAMVAGAPLVLWGGVPGAMFAPPYTWDDMREHIEALLEAWQDQPFIIASADQVPPDGDITFCRKIADLLRGRKRMR